MANNRRRLSRSASPVPSKRSWHPSSAGNSSRVQRGTPSPHGNMKQTNMPKYGGGRGYSPPPRAPNRSFDRGHSPQHKRRRSRSKSPAQGHGLPPPPYMQKPSMQKHRDRGNDRSESKLPQRSLSPRPAKHERDRGKKDGRLKRSRSPDYGRSGPPAKKKALNHSPTRNRMRSISPRARSPIKASSSKKRHLSVSPPPKHKSNATSQQKVSSADKKKIPRTTLHKRFTAEDQEPFTLVENVTIAILRNPNAEPSEDVTVKKVFDASLFKMVHKKTEGKKPIFDREEIKVWRHDENLADDPDFERRLVRVKAAEDSDFERRLVRVNSASGGKGTSDSLSRMSPETLRKTFGLQIGGRSKSGSPHCEQKIRLDPKPDPRYESKFREQVEREENVVKKKSEPSLKRNVENRKGGGPDGRKKEERFGKKEEERFGKKEEERFGRKDNDHKSAGRSREETYDLRQALDKRRNDREETGSFRIEVRRGEREASTELFYRDSAQGRRISPRRHSPERGRNVVVDQNRERNRPGSPPNRNREFEPRDDDRRWNGGGGRGRGGGRGGMRGGGDWQNRMPRDGDMDHRGQRDRRPRYSMSPPNSRGKRGAFRGRGGRGRGRDFEDFNQEDSLAAAQQIDDNFKYLQHDDRDISPKMFRGRGGRGRFVSRGFGSSSFRANSRGFRGGGMFRGRGRGGFGKFGTNDRRSVDRLRDPSLEREWKHDMYNSLQAEDEPRNTMGT